MDSYNSFIRSHPGKRLPQWAMQKRSFTVPYMEKQTPPRAPWRFQWVLKRQLAIMAWPQYPEHLRYLLQNGLRRVVTLSPESRPPMCLFEGFFWIELPVEELKPPTMEQIKIFINFCEQAREFDEGVAVHDRLGRGRSGTLAACYMVRFCGLTAEMAVMQLRKTRPEAIDTLDQEKAVQDYYEELCRCPPDDTCWQPTATSMPE